MSIGSPVTGYKLTHNLHQLVALVLPPALQILDGGQNVLRGNPIFEELPTPHAWVRELLDGRHFVVMNNYRDNQLTSDWSEQQFKSFLMAINYLVVHQNLEIARLNADLGQVLTYGHYDQSGNYGQCEFSDGQLENCPQSSANMPYQAYEVIDWSHAGAFHTAGASVVWQWERDRKRNYGTITLIASLPEIAVNMVDMFDRTTLSG